MKKIIYLLTLISNSLIVNGQTFSVSADKLNILYFNVDNPLTIVSENCSCKDIIVKASVGNITGDSCKYTFRLNDTGRIRNFKTMISIFKRKNGMLTEIGQKDFRLKYAPKPFATVGNYREGKILEDVIRAQTFIRLHLDGFDFDANLHVESFTLSILRGDTCLYTNIENEGGTFNRMVLNAIASVRKGDTVIFKKIICQECGRHNNDIDPLVYYVTE